VQGITVADYERLLKFSFYINKNYDNFINSVQFALMEYFNFPLSVYTTFSKDHNGKSIVETIRGTAALTENLAKYRDHIWENDLFAQRIPALVQENPRKNVFIISDVADYDEFYSTEYGKLLIEANNPYQAVIYATISTPPPYHAVNVFKSKEHGDFTGYELDILKAIGSVYNESLFLYKQYHANKKYISFLDFETSALGFGLAVIDEWGAIVYCNHLFMTLASDIYGAESAAALITEIDHFLFKKTGIKISQIIKPVTLPIEKHEFYFEPRRIAGDEGNMQFLFVSVDKKKPETPAREIDFAGAYSMSSQEIEVASLILQGFDNKRIAETLTISLSTVKFHVRNIFKKLGVSNRFALISKFVPHE
jgi:DNA-binding CsgD family transcriptional regulator